MTTSTTTINDNNTTTDLTLTTMTVSATVNLNNSSGDDSVTTDGTGTTTVNANNSSGDDTITVNNAGSATVNLNNSTGSDDVDISDVTGSPLSATVNLNNSTGVDDNVSIAGTTVNATVNLNSSGQKGYNDDVSVTGANVTATVNLNNSLGNDDITIVGTSSTNATVNLNNSGGNDNVTIGSTTGATTATVNLNSSGGTDIVNIVGATTTATVSLTNSTGKGDVIKLVGQGTGKIDATNSIGNDTLIGANSTDTITGGIGNDTVDLEGAGTINAGAGNDLGIYTLSDHYSLSGGVLQSIHGDVDYYYGQAGTNTLRLVLTQDQANLAAVQVDLAAYSGFLATHPSADQTYTFHFGAAAGALTVAGWQTLQTAVVTPVISGTAREGQTLTASVTVTGGETGTATYQWQISANGSTGWANIAGATGSTYTPNETNENHYLRFQAVFTDGIGETVTATSTPTAAVLDAAPTVTTPTISGTVQEGQTLTASASAGQSDNPVTYAWYSSADNYANPIGSGPTYLVKEGDESFTIEVKATATNDNGVTASATGAATSAVLDAAPTITTPTITGTVQEGQTLTASASAGQSDNPVTYAWYSSADNYANPIGSGPTYLVKEGDETHTIEVKATATNDNGVTISATSAVTGEVLDAAPTITTPTITGTVQEGQTLTASATAGQSDNPVTYQWQQGGVDIAGATGATYLVKEGDEGHTLDVVATATNDNGVTISATSTPTAAVLDAAPTVTTPTITGTVQEGQTLTASASAGQGDNPVTYAWYSSADNYANPIGSGPTYLVKEGDETHTIEVKATATNDNGVTISATSAVTGAVLDAAPTITTPTITGTVQEGQTLTASATAGQSDNPVTYQWQQGGVDIAGATGATYLVKEGDEGHTLDVVATATNDNGVTISATSTPTAAVLDAAPTVTTPTITGTVQEGQTLTASATAGQSDNPVTYQWQQGGVDIAGATRATYLVMEGDEGHTLDVVATATNEQGLTASATSAVTGAVLDAAPTITTPTITGTMQEGQTLTASASAGQSDNPVTYAWYSSADNYANPIGSGPTYLVKEGDETHTIEVKATATNDNGVTISATSAVTGAVLDAAPTITTPTITGTVQEGQTLTASATAGQSDNPVTYQWQQGGVDIAGATGATYLVKEGDEGHTLDVVATATNDNGVTISATSTPTAAVLDAAPTVTTPTITGTVQEGQTLTASATAGQSDNPVTYQWQQGGVDIAGATRATYLVMEGDEGHTLDVVATATNEQGLTASATSAVTGAVLDAAPTITTPTISGTVQEGQTLTAAASSGQGDNAVTYAWYSSADGYTGVIGTGSTYLVKEGDEDHTIEVKATATNDNGVTISATSTPTAAVLDAAPTVTTPTITGTVQEGQTLTASASSGQGDNAVTYAWYSSADGYTGVIGSGSTYLGQEGDEDHTIEVKATATNDNGVTASATGAATSAVLDAAPTITTPTISGTVQEGQTLTASASAGQSDNPVTYAWYSSADNYANPIDSGPTYLVKEGDETHTIEVKATATNDNGVTISATSAVTGAVLDAAPTITTPTITGTVQEGQTLTASATAGQSDNPVTYAWYSSADGYTGVIGTGSTYLVKEGDEDHTIEVKATATNDNGITISATSTPTAAVLDAAPTVTTPTITGTAQEGQPLTAAASSGQGDNAVTYAWYSSADGYTGVIGSGSTYLGQEGDEDHTIEVKATATNDNGVTISATSTPTAAVLDAAPTVTTPTISGTVQEGQTLTASASSGQSDNPVTYAWYSSKDGYSGPIGTGSTYLVQEGNEDYTIEVKATATNEQGLTATATSLATSAVTDITLAFTTAASITGTAQEGQTLTAVNGTLNDSDAAVTRYQWTRNGVSISGATASTYIAVEADEGHVLRVVETATDSDGGPSTTSTSAPTAAVSDITLAFTAAASITGTAQEGQTLTALNGTLNDSDAAVTGYQWTRDGVSISGATASTYTAVEADEGHMLRVVETATDSDGGPSTTSTSAPTAAVSDITLAFTTAASITGTAQEGQTLTALNGTLNDSDAAVTGYQWTRDGVAISGATASTYTAVEADEGHVLRVVETATDSDGGPTTTSTSAPTAAVSDITLAFTTAAAVIGTAQEGQVLTAVAGTLNDSDAAVTGYQWTRDGVNISGATGSTYTVVEADETHVLRVVETATDSDGGPTTTSTSAPTGAVTDITLAFTTAAAVTGTAQEGQVLTAVAGTLNDSDAAVTGYQWTRDGVNISGATGSTYTVVEADETHVLRVVETATDSDGGPTTSSTSAPTSAVTDITLAFTTAAAVTGTAQEGQVLTAVAGTLNDSDAAVTGYQWTRDGVNISGATGSTYTVVEADETHVLRVVETATDSDGGPTTSSTSAPTSAVTDITLVPTITAGTHTVTGNNGHVTFIVTFPEAVATVGTNDFTRFGTATGSSSPPTIASVSGSGASYTVTVDYAENKNMGLSLGLNFVNTGNLVHDTEAGESGNLAVATNITTPQFSSLAPAGIAGSPINLGLDDPSGVGVATTITVSGILADWRLNQGINNGDGSWTVTTSDPTSLTVTTGSTFAGAMVLNVSESWSNADGTTGTAFVADNVEAYPASPIFAVSGDDTLTGGTSANNEFVFAQPIGNDKIYNFTAGRDTIDLIGFGLSGYGDLAIANDGNGNAVVTLGSGETITLKGIDATALSPSNFVFDTEPVSTNSGTMMIRDGAILPLGGTITNSSTIAINSTGDESDLEILVRGATLQGGGQVVLSDSSQNVVFGGDPSAVLDNVDNTISGAGQFGNGTLTLQNEGVIEATGANALVIDTRANAIVNTGTLAASGAGGLVVNSALTGGGNAKISGSSSLEFGAASDAKVSFDTGATGTLKLDQPGAFTGTVAGFTGYNAIDLANLVDGDQATIGYAATADNSGGTLTLGDAAQTHSVSLALLGQYAAASDFAVASDGHGGTLVTLADPSQNHALTLANSSH